MHDKLHSWGEHSHLWRTWGLDPTRRESPPRRERASRCEARGDTEGFPGSQPDLAMEGCSLPRTAAVDRAQGTR